MIPCNLFQNKADKMRLSCCRSSTDSQMPLFLRFIIQYFLALIFRIIIFPNPEYLRMADFVFGLFLFLFLNFFQINYFFQLRKPQQSGPPISMLLCYMVYIILNAFYK